MRAAIALALLLPLVAGCATRAPAACAPKLDLCVAADDGWILQAAAFGNASAPRYVLLVHGLNEDHHSYDKLAAQVAAAGWRVVALDSRGHGASTLRSDGTTRTLTQFGPDDFLKMERDITAIEAKLGKPALVVGASVGANEALREATRLDARVALVLLSPGLNYRGLTTADADAAHTGPALFLASAEDSYAASSARALAAQHPGPHEIHVWSGKGHGTNLLDDEARGSILAWVAALPAQSS